MMTLVRLGIIAGCLLLLPGHGWAGQNTLDTDNFGGSNGTALSSYNANWVIQDSGAVNEMTIQGTPGVGVPTSGWHANYRTGQTWTNDQWASITADATNLADAMFVVGLRMATDNTFKGYLCGADPGVTDGKYRIRRFDGWFTATTLASSTQTYAVGDVLNCQIVGTVITILVNGVSPTGLVSYDTASDGTKYASGNPGLWLSHSTGPIRLGGTWRAGSVTTTSVSTPSRMMRGMGK